MAMTKQEYEFYKSLDPSELEDKDRKDLIDYECAEAKAPSLDDLNWANEVIKVASKNPSTLGRELKESGDYAKAMGIIDADRAYVATKGPRKMDAYVQPVKRIPDDLNSQFNFNWKSAYENQPGNEKLRNTEADYDKLKKFIDSKMYDVTDPVKFREIAYDLRMYNPNTMKWSEFINSEQGKEFRKYVKDVEKYQRDKRVNEIFDKESNFLVDFGLPVAKEYAKKNYENIDGLGDLIGPLAADFATNAVMMSTKPAAGVVAPVISEAGQYAFNDEDPAVALIGAGIGAAVNKGTPYALQRGTTAWRRQSTGAGKEAAKEIVEGMDKMASKAAEVQRKLNGGAVYETKFGYVSPKDKVIYTDAPDMLPDEFTGFKVKGINEFLPFKQKLSIKGVFDKKGREVISKKDYGEYLANEHLLRSLPFTNKWKNRKATRQVLSDMGEEEKTKLISEVHDLKAQGKPYSDLSARQMRALGYEPKESFASFVARETPDPLRAYTTNMLGRDRFANPLFRLPTALGFDPNKFIEEKKKKKQTISEVFGE